ncbi:uncharacterized protein LOC127752362 isoform X3 [Frankliniella occidentalis]|uniref:Uncharacterized protein LOC127752362 isoform X3 n=1 Tax=Frankliniella occidentalis TaxID=133901 RepID=A0A9C6XC00_FRAOC|nr:uncharacterized protein LOC127752362 isoform X3 [Frankliniella occidentalis]
MRHTTRILVALVLGPMLQTLARLALRPSQLQTGLPPEVQCALTLLPPYLQPVEPFNSSLFITGRSRWLGQLLVHLPPVAGVSVFNVSARPRDPNPRHIFGISSPRALILVVADEPRILIQVASQLYSPYFTRIILWTTAREKLPPAALMEIANATSQFCLRDVRFAVTVGDGSTRMYLRGRSKCGDLLVTWRELGRWTAARGWDRRTAVMPRPCATWIPPETGHLPTLIYQNNAPLRPLLSAFSQSTNPGELVMEEIKQSLGVCFDTKVINSSDVHGTSDGLRDIFECQRDITLFRSPIQQFMHRGLSIFTWRMRALLAAVPRGLGPQLGILHSLTCAFSGPLWCAAVSAAATVCLSLSCLSRQLRADWVGVVLQTLAPLVNQTLGPQRWRQHRLVYGTWILACVVLGAAYTGHLRSELTVTAREREMNSLEELETSNLKIVARYDLDLAIDGLASWDYSRFSFQTNEIPLSSLLRRVVESRDTAVLMSEDEVCSAGPLGDKVHLFRLTSGSLQKTRFLTTVGSPFERHLIKTLGRLRAAGIHSRWLVVHQRKLAAHFGTPQSFQSFLDDFDNRWPAIARSVRALQWTEVQPAFIVLGAGLLVAATALGFELCLDT